MHELGVVIAVVNKIERIAAENELTLVDTIVLQIGELSSMIPKYIEDCYLAAADGTMLENTKLKIEILTATALCTACKKVFRVVENNGFCPHCGENHWELLSGKEFMIKEIIAY